MLKALLAIMFALPAALHAQPRLEDIVSLDVLDGGRAADGTYQAALRLTLADGWKTYWRAPGDSGIPPRIDWGRSQNLGGATITWPAPEVFDQDGTRTIGYKHQLVLPIRIAPAKTDKPVRLKGRIDFGVCSDICIPADLRFDHELDAAAPRNPAIAAAIAARPLSEHEAGVTSATCRLEPGPDGLRVTATVNVPPTGGDEMLVFEPSDPAIWASEAKVSRKGGVLTATSDLIHTDGKAYALDRSGLRMTVLGRSRAVDIRGCSAD